MHDGLVGDQPTIIDNYNFNVAPIHKQKNGVLTPQTGGTKRNSSKLDPSSIKVATATKHTTYLDLDGMVYKPQARPTMG